MNTNHKQEFISENKCVWAGYPLVEAKGKLLIESASIPSITHANGLFALILNQAVGLVPVWLEGGDYDLEFFRSYVPSAEIIPTPRPPTFSRLKLIALALLKYVRAIVTRDLLAFSYDGVRYGDIVYDVYLKRRRVATLRKMDRWVFRYILVCISNHERFLSALRSDNFKAVLVAHQIGLHCGVLLRVALRHGFEGYLRSGHHEETLHRFTRLEEIVYPRKPSQTDIDKILTNIGDVDAEFDRAFTRQVSGKGNFDAVNAFSDHNTLYTERSQFNREYSLETSKKNVFVMLHAMNDHPHAHFKGMLFKDYYDWFIQTLNFALEHESLNWVFKQHPSVRHYPTEDVSIDQLFANLPSHVVYIGEENQIDTRSLMACADLIVTCAGSAGFELPALAGIPSVTAGDSHYSGNLGFAYEPRSKEEYFSLLQRIHTLPPLTDEQQRVARAVYLYIYEYSIVPFAGCPGLSLEEEKNRDYYGEYWTKVLRSYNECEYKIKSEIDSYISRVAGKDFSRLNVPFASVPVQSDKGNLSPVPR